MVNLKWLSNLPFLKDLKYEITTKYGDWKVLSLESEFGTIDIPFEESKDLTEKNIRSIYLQNIKKVIKAKADYYLMIYKELQKEENGEAISF